MALVEKRPRSPTGDGGALIETKKAKSNALMTMGPERTSSMLAPIMMLQGHGGEVLSFQFDPAGKHCASAGHDKDIFLWEVYGECANYAVLKGHKAAVLQIQYSIDNEHLWSCSADKTVMLWDVETGKRLKKMVGHSSFVNSVCPSRHGDHLACSGSDDGMIFVWDPRQRGAAVSFTDEYQVTAVEFSDDGLSVFSGGLDNEVKAWDLKMPDEARDEWSGHTDTITGLKVSPDGTMLLSNSMDNTLRMWDTRPYVEGERCKRVMRGHAHSFEKNLLRCSWSADMTKVASGSSDRMVHIWDADEARLLYKLPGHTGSVNDVAFHPYEPIIGSCSSDKKIYLGEIKA
mmetsp:Transcript_9271/g.17982  ORF Transcript_9271/g.17982 Transcript_9271/m.17982 type:complete len:345 (+) Transcript_9271:38-1072(+)|eukprot:CAMPEP_0173393424 /NCGR_PEP_ID=MMETSP1356-20130122/22100_1 /TAXON_ID=77927 ORGANISM="Hemiselmis virescens, Strain PCC157" /NCGR_SAMPLE_ID=MMETSP1356 /ASSEMBLY_ACC=CAM_ASM_000847 /LENGTH=344 /DNA_ID=CAMNT_0014351439 /DNA_START=29 /DNA_END=1063 /DNA_ORIENTATION=-